MIQRLLWILQLIALLIPVGVFLTYVVAAEGDEWTAEHFMATGLSSIPLAIVIAAIYVVLGGSDR